MKRDKEWKITREMANFRGKPIVSMASGVYLGPLTLFTGSYEGTIYVWESFNLVKVIEAHSGPIFEMTLNVMQNSFITCSDGLAKIWSTVPGGVLGEIWDALVITAVVVHLSVMDESREALGYLMLRADETLGEVRKLIETSDSSTVYIDKRIRQMIRNTQKFLFVSNRGQNLVRQEDETLHKAKDLYSEVCLVLGQDRIDLMIDSESVTDIDRLIIKPDGLVDQTKIRMNFFEERHSEIRSIDWINGSIIFGTNEHVIFGIESLKGRRSPEQLSNAISSTHVSSICTHPAVPLIYTACADGVIQIWDQNSKDCIQSKHLGFAVSCMDTSPDGCYLLAATSTGCLALKSSNLEEVHWIHYRPQRITSINAVSFSHNGQYLATGTNEGRVDVFDVHGRMHLTTWANSRLQMELDAGGLEIDFSDGVLLCKMIEEVLKPFGDGRMITELKSYALVVDRPPSLNAWKNRPKSYAQKLSLMGEGLQTAFLAAAQAIFLFEKKMEELNDVNFQPWESKTVKDQMKDLTLQRIVAVKEGMDRFRATMLIGNERPVDRTNLFGFLRFLKAMDVSIIEQQKENLAEHKSLTTELQTFKRQVLSAERDMKKGRENILETKRRLIYAHASKSVLVASSLGIDLDMQERRQKQLEERFDEIKTFVVKSQQKFDELVYKIERSKEDIFIFLGSGTGPKPHTKPITGIDWSIDGLVLQTVSLHAGEINFWQMNSLQQLFAEGTANKLWATHRSPFGWSVKGLTRFECMDSQYFTKLDRGPVQSESSHLLGVGDKTGRILVTNFPFQQTEAEIEMSMADSFDSEIQFKRMTVEIEKELISEIAVLLQTPKTRITVVQCTGPTKVIVHFGPPIDSDDRRAAFELTIVALGCLEAGKMRPFNLLKHCRGVKGPSSSTNIGHASPVLAAVFDSKGERLMSVGEADRTICVWRILRAEDAKKGRRISDKVQSRLTQRSCQALEFLRLGDGVRIEKSLINFLYEWDIAKSGIVPDKIDPVVKLVSSFKTNEVLLDLERRGIKIVGLTERDEFAARLCTAMTTPENMTVAEIRAELTQAKVSSANVFERSQLLKFLQDARQEGTEFPRPIPFEFQRIAPKHELIIARTKAKLADAESAKKHKRSLVDRENDVLEIFDAVCLLDELEAQRLGVDQQLRGLVALIKSNRLEMAATCARRKPYLDTVRKGIDINSTVVKDPTDVDWLVAGIPAATSHTHLIKGGELYEAAVRATGGTLLSGEWYQFKEVPGREFQYVRFNENGDFVDQLFQHWSESSSKTKRQPVRVPGLKRVRWGSRFYAKSNRDIIKAQSLPTQLKQDSQKPMSTAYLYQAPVGIPRLYGRLLPSAVQIEDFFTTLDKRRVGFVEMDAFEDAILTSLRQCELLGLCVQDAQDGTLMKKLIFSYSILAVSGYGVDDIGDKIKLQKSDLFDFLLPNVNVLGHLVFKVRIMKLEGEVKIGLVDVTRIPEGVGLEADWLWPHFPAWFIDSTGGLYRSGQKISQSATRLLESDIVVVDLDQNLGVVRFFKEGFPDYIGLIADVQGFVSCAVQFTTIDDELELLPF